jgi:hypothetical protein
MFLALQDPKPFIVVPIPAPVHEASIFDVILSAMGLTGALIVASLVLGAGFALLLMIWHRRHPPEADRLPPISPLIPDSSSRRESSQAR